MHSKKIKLRKKIKKKTKKQRGGMNMLVTYKRKLEDITFFVCHGNTQAKQVKINEKMYFITCIDYGRFTINNLFVLNYIKDFLVEIDFNVNGMFIIDSYEEGKMLTYENYTPKMIEFTKNLNMLTKRLLGKHLRFLKDNPNIDNYDKTYNDMNNYGLFKFKLKMGPCEINEEYLQFLKNDDKKRTINGAFLERGMNSSYQIKSNSLYNRLKFNFKNEDNHKNLMSRLLNSLGEGTYFFTNCRAIDRRYKFTERQKEELEDVGRILSTPAPYRDLYVDTSHDDFDKICYQIDCQRNDNLVKCEYCNNNLCPGHFKYFRDYLENGKEDCSPEENHFYECILDYNYEKENGIFMDKNIVNESYKIHKPNILPVLSSLIENIKKEKKNIYIYNFDYGAVCNLVISFMNYLNYMYKILDIQNKYKSIFASNILFLNNICIKYLTKLKEGIINKTFETLEQEKKEFLDNFWEFRLDFRDDYEEQILSNL